MSDSSDSEVQTKVQKKHAKSSAAVAAVAAPQEYSIKPEKGDASVDTSTWPLLLKVKCLSCKESDST
jgi:hypothetical protein